VKSLYFTLGPWLIWGAYKKSPPGYSREPCLTPYDHPFLQTGGSQLPVKTFVANFGQTVSDTTVVCIDSL